MAYSDFDLRKALTDFQLTDQTDLDLFAGVSPVVPGTNLSEWLNEYSRLALGVGSEKARSEYLITPILSEARQAAGRTFNFLPGVTFDVDKSRGLSGICDYLVARSTEVYFVRGPLLAVVEGKKDNINDGLGQCVAEMVAIQLFNERENTPLSAVYGCVTTGNLWRFLKLEGTTLFIDKTEYYLSNLPAILGILVSIANG